MSDESIQNSIDALQEYEKLFNIEEKPIDKDNIDNIILRFCHVIGLQFEDLRKRGLL